MTVMDLEGLPSHLTPVADELLRILGSSMLRVRKGAVLTASSHSFTETGRKSSELGKASRGLSSNNVLAVSGAFMAARPRGIFIWLAFNS